MSRNFFTARFRVYGEPKGQPRPRAFARNGRARVYDPHTAEGWKGCIAADAQEHRPPAPLVGPVRVDIDWFLPRPKRLMRRRDPDGPLPHDGKPDRDNLDKAVLDALQTLGFFRDDGQVATGILRKWYCGKPGDGDAPPGAWILVEGQYEEADDALAVDQPPTP